MKILVVEDDFITSQVLQEIMLAFGECDIADNGMLAIDLFEKALDGDKRYDVIFLDIMMPEIDGQQVLARIREIEKARRIFGLDAVKVVMSTALDDFENIKNAFEHQCEGYIVKPIHKDKIVAKLIELEMI